MDYHPKIELGQIIQTVGSLIAALLACAFAWAFLVKDVEYSNKAIDETKKAVVSEAILREKEDDEIRLELQTEATQIKEEIQAVEDRQRFLLEDMRDDIKFLVRERRENESGSSVK